MIRTISYCRWTSTLASLRNIGRSIHMGRVVPEIDPDLGEKIDDKSVDPKNLKTRRKFGFTPLPAQLHAIAEERLSRFSDQSFREEVKYLSNVMYNLKLPDDKFSLKMKEDDIETELEIRGKIKEAKTDPDGFSFIEDARLVNEELSQLIQGKLADRRRDWRYFNYDERASLMYMATRLAPNYASLRTVMKEIRNSDPDFKPKSVLDFGSGMGTTIFAVNETWPNEVTEFMNIDLSKEQQYLCEYLLRGGKNSNEPLANVFHKQYLPSSNRVKYDMVVAAFSMLELPNRELRANTIENLWNKTNDLLIFVERGNKGGFETISEARSFILDMTGHDATRKVVLAPISKPVLKQEIPTSHIIAPCPHEFMCPRHNMPSKKRMDVCRFRVSFEPLEFGQKRASLKMEEFSYVVLRKGPHKNYLHSDCPIRWPRIVEAKTRSGKQVTHKLCCPIGNLAEIIITRKKYGDASYELAKASQWGDVLPIKVNDTYEPRNYRLLKSK